jgi:hypothetical protein
MTETQPSRSQPRLRPNHSQLLRLLVVITFLVNLGACTRSASDLSVSAPSETNRASILITGQAKANAAILIDNGALPTTTTAGLDGRFSADVPLRPDANNRLQVTAAWRNGQAKGAVDVRQRRGQLTGALHGRVIDGASLEPVNDARVSYGTSSATTGADGFYSLTQVPEGTVVAHVRKPSALTRLAVGTVIDGRGEAGLTVLQSLAAPITVGPGPETSVGPGWRVDIPAGALPTPTALRITPLVFSGAMETFGAPLIDLSPSGLRLDKPITVTVDPSVLGLDPRNVQVRGVDPDVGTTRTFDTTVSDAKLQFQMTDLRGEEIRESWINAPEEPTRCKPYTSSSQADVALAYLNFTLVPILAAGAGHDALTAYLKYLTPGSPSLTRFKIRNQDELHQFSDTDEARQTLQRVWNAMQAAVSEKRVPLGPPDNPTTRQLKDLGVGQNLDITWSKNFSTPALVAGGVGGAQLTTPGVSIPDERHIDGPIRLIPHATDRGVRTRVTLEDDLELQVLDSVDFCPGFGGNRFQSILFTLPMSRLEVTPHRLGHYVTTQLVEARVKLDTAKLNHDITELYPSNDVDKDGVPDAQPWEGASYKLDNCPAEPNPDQADKDGDGVGDACQSRRYAFVGTFPAPAPETSLVYVGAVSCTEDLSGLWVVASSSNSDYPVTKENLIPKIKDETALMSIRRPGQKVEIAHVPALYGTLTLLERVDNSLPKVRLKVVDLDETQVFTGEFQLFPVEGEGVLPICERYK